MKFSTAALFLLASSFSASTQAASLRGGKNNRPDPQDTIEPDRALELSIPSDQDDSASTENILRRLGDCWWCFPTTLGRRQLKSSNILIPIDFSQDADASSEESILRQLKPFTTAVLAEGSETASDDDDVSRQLKSSNILIPIDFSQDTDASSEQDILRQLMSSNISVDLCLIVAVDPDASDDDVRRYLKSNVRIASAKDDDASSEEDLLRQLKIHLFPVDVRRHLKTIAQQLDVPMEK